MKRRRNHLASNSDADSIDVIDETMANNAATLNAFNVEEGETNSDYQSEAGGFSKKCKSRRKLVDDENILKEVVSAVDRTTQSLCEVLLQCANQNSSKDKEMLEHLVEIGIEDHDQLLNAQTFLIENPIKRRVF